MRDQHWKMQDKIKNAGLEMQDLEYVMYEVCLKGPRTAPVPCGRTLLFLLFSCRCRYSNNVNGCPLRRTLIHMVLHLFKTFELYQVQESDITAELLLFLLYFGTRVYKCMHYKPLCGLIIHSFIHSYSFISLYDTYTATN